MVDRPTEIYTLDFCELSVNKRFLCLTN